jgi:outer membrane protein
MIFETIKPLIFEEALVRKQRFVFFAFTICLIFLLAPVRSFAQKIAYVNSQKILATFKEAQDAQDRLDKINRDWQDEAQEMQKQFQEQGEALESQSLLLSEERKREKQQELQNLMTKIRQYQEQKWGQNGELYKRNEEIMGPVIEKINAAIKKIGEEESYDYIFDTVAGNILYASPSQTDLTDLVLQELEKGLESKSTNQ